MPIRILFWNMKNFNLRHLNNPLLQVFLDTVNPAAAAANYDIVVIVEPQVNPSLNRGDFARGQGKQAMWRMRNLLRAQNAVEWEVVPPYCLANGGKRNEAIAIFYNGDMLHLHGPDVDNAVTGRWRTLAPGGGHANLGTADAGGGTKVGRFAWMVGGASLEFDTPGERRPYLVEFEEVASGQHFLLAAAHSPSPGPKTSAPGKKNLFAITGTRNLGRIPEASTARVLPVVVMGDFNTCTRPACSDFLDSVSSGAQDTLAGAAAPLFAEGTFSSSSTLAHQYHALANAENLLIAGTPNSAFARKKAIWVGKLGHMVDHVCGELPGVRVDLRDALRNAWRACRMSSGLSDANAAARSNAVVGELNNFLDTVDHAGTLTADRAESLAIRAWLTNDLAEDAAAESLAAAGTAEEEHWAVVTGLLCEYVEQRIGAGVGAGTFADVATQAADLTCQGSSAAARAADPTTPVGDGALAATAQANLAAVVTALRALVVSGKASALSVVEAFAALAETCDAQAQAAATNADAVPFAVVGGLAASRVSDAGLRMNPVVVACNTACGNAATAATNCTVAGGLAAANARVRATAAATTARAVYTAFNALALAGNTGAARRSMAANNEDRVPASPRVRVEFFAELAAHASVQAAANAGADLARQWSLVAGLATRHAVFAAAGVVGATAEIAAAITASEDALAATNANGQAMSAAASAAAAALPARIYRTHIARTRTSLVTSAEPMLRWRRRGARKVSQASYTSHAYDHMLTIGFAAVANPRFVDLLLERMPDISTVADGTSKQIKRSFENLFRGSWNLILSVSDHLPVSIEVTP